jgi:hypothetical protein
MILEPSVDQLYELMRLLHPETPVMISSFRHDSDLAFDIRFLDKCECYTIGGHIIIDILMSVTGTSCNVGDILNLPHGNIILTCEDGYSQSTVGWVDCVKGILIFGYH